MILEKIVARKNIVLREQKMYFNVEDFKTKIDNKHKPASFYDAISKKGLSIIGEIKRASPSKGVIREELNHIEIAHEYEKAVEAISILTEKDFFKGSSEYLKDISREVSIPILRKDFIIDKLQIYEGRALGASCILLITSILSDAKLKKFINLIEELEMDALVEVHNEEEVQRAVEAGAKIIGINNRNLKDFSIDLNTTLKLRKLIPNNILVISESGIQGEDDIEFLKNTNLDGVLVGESFMKADDILKKAKEFKRAYEN